MGSVKQLLDRIEVTKLATLPDSTETVSDPTKDTFGTEESKKAAGGDELDFLADQPKMAAPGASTADPFSGGFPPAQKSAAASNMDPFAAGGMGMQKPMQSAPVKTASIDPFASVAAPNLNS